jgi:hypothetical protein
MTSKIATTTLISVAAILVPLLVFAITSMGKLNKTLTGFEIGIVKLQTVQENNSIYISENKRRGEKNETNLSKHIEKYGELFVAVAVIKEGLKFENQKP